MTDVTPAQLRERSTQLVGDLADYAFTCRMRSLQPAVRAARMQPDLQRRAAAAEALAGDIERIAERSRTWDRLSEFGARGEWHALRDTWIALVREAEELFREP